LMNFYELLSGLCSEFAAKADQSHLWPKMMITGVRPRS
jgi:hypothetical protein